LKKDDPFPFPPATGDMPVEDFRRAAHQVADEIADYLAGLESYSVLPDVEPGAIKATIPEAAPQKAEPLDDVLEDFRKTIRPNITHWQHPGFLAYFPSVASGPGILGEMLSAGLNSNVMFWRNAPASTEVEERVIDWLRQMYGLPEIFDGMLTDTASISSVLSMVAAREQNPKIRDPERGLSGRDDLGPLTVYLSEEAHMSIEKAARVVGVGRAYIRRIPANDRYEMCVDQLRTQIKNDIEAGCVPFAVTATLGTTSSTSVDPVDAIADVCEEFNLWLHVDAAYAGTAAILPEYRDKLDGWERADSIIVNPHKWMFTPFDASVLLFRDPAAFRSAFSLVPEYLKTDVGEEVRNYNEYGIQLGRRFRALKLWMILRYFGVEGVQSRLRDSLKLAADLHSRLETSSDWELLAPMPFSTLCFRRVQEGLTENQLDTLNEQILEGVNASGSLFLSHTKLKGRYAIRVALGNPRTEMRQIDQLWIALNKEYKCPPSSS
jgi:aromatic-L-amino-acid decarboxylase